MRAVAENALAQPRVECLEGGVRGVHADEGLHRAARIDRSQLDDRLQLEVFRFRLAREGDERRLVHDRAADELGPPRHQLEHDVAAAAGAEHDRGREPELLDQRRGVIGLRGDRHRLPVREPRAARAAAAVVGHGRELVGEPLGGAGEVAGVTARRRR